jgi:2-(1,2-epoxy-1,2-dihydrophenyl)acetyl-CoA isomerase
MALLNPILSAKQALDWGIVNQVLPEADLFPKAMELARTIAQGSLEAFGETKRMILSGVTESLESQMDVEARTIARIAGTRNGLEGVQAFIEKRPPRFSGNEGR